jgi:hypothetical protein
MSHNAPYRPWDPCQLHLDGTDPVAVETFLQKHEWRWLVWLWLKAYLVVLWTGGRWLAQVDEYRARQGRKIAEGSVLFLQGADYLTHRQWKRLKRIHDRDNFALICEDAMNRVRGGFNPS